MILLEIIEERKEEVVYHFTFKDIWSITQETIFYMYIQWNNGIPLYRIRQTTIFK